MPKAGDLKKVARGSNDVHSPLRGLLDYTDISQTAGVGANMIVAGIQGAFGEVFGLIKALTGIDLTPILDLFGQSTTDPRTGLPNGILGRSLTNTTTGASTSGASSMDINALAAPFESVFGSLPIVGPIASILFDALTGGLLGSIIPTGTGTIPDITSVFGDIFGFLGLAADPAGALFGLGGLGGGTFDPIAAGESFITNILNPTGLLASIPALFDALTGGLLGGVIPTGTGNLGDISNVFGNLFGLTGLLGDPLGNLFGLGTGSFDQSGAASSLITNVLSPTGLLADVPAIVAALTGGLFPGITDLTGAESMMGDLLGSFLNLGGTGLGSGSFDPITAAEGFITDVLTPTGLLADAASIVSALTGGLFPSITDLGGLGSLYNDLLGSFLGLSGTGIGAGGFDPIAAGQGFLQNVLTPAGALSTFAQLPGHLFGVLAPGNLTNMLPDPGFTNSAHFDDPTMWDGTVGRSTPLGSLKLTADGSYQQYVGVPIGSDATQVTNVGIYTFWQGLVVTAGAAINLAVEAFDQSQNVIPNPTGRVVMSITNPTANSATYAGAPAQQPPVPAQGTAGWDGAAVPGWVYLSGPYRPPTGTAYIAISPEITTNTQSGTVHFDDAYMMPDQGLIDSSILSNFANLLDGSIPGTKIGGIQGIEDMITTWTQHVDGLFNAVNDGPTQSDVPFFQLFNLMQMMSLNSSNAQSLAANNTVLLGNKINKPAITGGTQPSGEANFTHATMPDSTTLPIYTLPNGQAIAGWIRVGQSASKGFVDFLAAKAAAGTTGISMNLFKQNPTTGVKTNVYSSPDISAVIPASTTAIPSISQMLIPGGVTVAPNDLLWGELVNLSGSNLLVGKRSTPIPDHFNTYPRNIGHTRTVATLGTSPATLSPADTATSQVAPVLNFGIASVPADYHLPQMDTLPPAPSSGPGNYPYTIPTFITTGDLIDLIGVGGGGSGMSEWNAGVMAGGLGGTPAGAQFVYGSDIHGTGLPVIPTGTTQLQCAVGAGGPHPGGYWANGNPGTATVWTCLNGPSAGTVLLTCAAGAGGSGSVGLSSGTGSGPTPNPLVFDGKSYAMGPNVGINATGAIPGGGGGGATWYELGGSGARGQGWAYAQKYVSP